MRKVTWLDGQAIDEDDLSAQGQYLRREYADMLVGQAWFDQGDESIQGDTGLNPVRMRVIGRALALFPAGTTGSTLSFSSGAVIWNTGLIDGNEAQLVLHSYPEPLDVALPGGVFTTIRTATVPSNALGFERWDIVVASIAIANDPALFVDFKDATTELLTSTPAVTKQRSVMTLQYLTGTLATTEPAIPAGFVKLFRIQVPNGTATPSRYVDYRFPAGSILWSTPVAIGAPLRIVAAAFDPSAWAATHIQRAISPWSANQNSQCQIPLVPPRPIHQGSYWNGAGQWANHATQMRLRRVIVNGKLSAGTQVKNAQLRMGMGTAEALTYVVQDFSTSFPDNTLGTYVLVPSDPCWVDGASAPGFSVQNGFSTGQPISEIFMLFIANRTDDVIYSVMSEWYGGL